MVTLDVLWKREMRRVPPSISELCKTSAASPTEIVDAVCGVAEKFFFSGLEIPPLVFELLWRDEVVTTGKMSVAESLKETDANVRLSSA